MTQFVVVGKCEKIDGDCLYINSERTDSTIDTITIKAKGKLLSEIKSKLKKDNYIAIKGFIYNNNEMLAEKVVFACGL